MEANEFFKARTLFDACGLDYTGGNLAANDDESLKAKTLDIWNGQEGWVLGHAMDGVLWGRIASGGVVLANDADPQWGAPLKKSTLLDLRVFSPDKELRIWRKDNQLSWCLASESSEAGSCLAYDEHQILISAKRKAFQKYGDVTFSLIEGPGGQRHAIPIDWDGEAQAYRLWVRHYAQPRSDTGMLKVTESRLMGIGQTTRTRGRRP